MDPENPIPEDLVTEKSSFLIPPSLAKEDKLCVLVASSPKAHILSSCDSNGCKKCTSGASDCDSCEKQSTTTTEDKIVKTGCRKYAGLLLSLFSGMMFSLGAVIVKLMSSYHPFSLALFRFQGILLPSIPLIAYASCVNKQPVLEPIWPITNKQKRRTLVLVALRGAIGCTALFMHYYSLQYLSGADSLVIGSCTPIFVSIVAFFFLGEKLCFFLIFVAFIAIGGVAVITRPPLITGQDTYDRELLIGTGFALGCTFVATFAITLIRYLRNVHFAVITFAFGTWGTVQSVVCGLIIGVLQFPKTLEDLFLAAALAMANSFAQYSFTLALQLEQAGPVTLVRTLDVVFAFFWQFVLLGVQPDIYSIIGAAIVIGGVLLAAFQKWVSTLPENHPSRQRYFFVLK